ncbi:thioredoxin-dependent thiol peroxidase [Terasakiella pusilla]|jgi:peroxiredoxin|uniref:thioredoxin-dependent thiol peroxidase n=1 Tax=Terasakiella pusilla TaxID=64973 RepID=UPI00048C8EED|nr:thioredoxin-dependent thiol peroxidase [Terasakiella pusilla]
MTLEVGTKAPDFKLPTDNAGELSLSDLKGKKVVLYFYPKDSTPGCTTQAQGFRDLKDAFAAENCVIVGASKDTVKRHDNFVTKQELNFPLVSDAESDLCETYGIWQEKKMYGKTFMGIVRTTFLIDEEGVIQKVWPKVKVKGHVEEVLDAVKAL